MSLFLNWFSRLYSLIGLYHTNGSTRHESDSDEEMDEESPNKNKKRKIFDGKLFILGEHPTKNQIRRNGQLNMEVVVDKDGKSYLMGGICIELHDFDSDREFPGIDENGWNGTVEATLDGNGRIVLDQDWRLEDDHFVFKGRVNIAPFHYVPYEFIGPCVGEEANHQVAWRPRRYNNRFGAYVGCDELSFTHQWGN